MEKQTEQDTKHIELVGRLEEYRSNNNISTILWSRSIAYLYKKLFLDTRIRQGQQALGGGQGPDLQKTDNIHNARLDNTIRRGKKLLARDPVP